MIPRKTARFTQPLVARAQAWAPHPQARRRWVLAGLSLALVTGAALFTASGVHAQAAAGAPQVPVVVVGAQAVGAGVALDGSLQAVRQSVLSAQASGRIASLSVKAGDRVKAGQVLAVLGQPSLREDRSPGVAWVYDGTDCRFRLLLYPDIETNKRTVLSVETESDSPCSARLTRP